MIRPLLLSLALLAALSGRARADSDYRAVATLTDEPITIDGKLDEPAWRHAQVLGKWHQTRVRPGAPVVEPTEVRILYDRDNLYFAFYCYDSQPDKIAAYTVQNEAFLHQDDNVTVIIDTMMDHRNAYYFWTNPLGVRTDGRILDDGEAFSTDWQGEWESMGSIQKDGWIVEIRIPFLNFQYENGSDHTFGILLDREEARLQEWSNWTPDGVNSAKVSRYPHLTGLKGIAPRSLLFTTIYTSAQALWKGAASLPEVIPNAGVEVRLAPTNWMSLRLTVNPDFAQAEIDQDVLWLDVLERQLPERRRFFLDGGDLFVSPINLFYSRRIAPRADDRVWAGLLATGKKNGVGFSVFDVQSDEHRPDGTIESVNSAVVRVQKDLFKRSLLNLTLLNRYGDGNVATAGADVVLNLIEEVFVYGQYAHSFDGKTNADSDAWHVQLHRFDTNNEFWLKYEDIGANFKSPLGFIPIVDKQSVWAHGFYSFFTHSKLFLKRIDVTYDDFWRSNHKGIETRHLRQLVLVPYLLDELALNIDLKADRNFGFEDWQASVGFTLFPNEWRSFTANGIVGRFLGGDFMAWNAGLNLKLGSHLMLRFTAFQSWSSNLPSGSPLVDTANHGAQWSFYGQLRYQFTPNLFARLTIQTGQIDGITDFSKVRGTVLDGMVAWHYRVGSDLFLVYTSQPIDGQQMHRVLLKAALSF